MSSSTVLNATLYVDFAFTMLTLVDASPAPPPPPPQPTLVRLNSTTFLLSWPVSDYSYWLDSSTDLSAAGWVQVNEPVNVVDGFNVVNVPITGPCGFYRLCN